MRPIIKAEGVSKQYRIGEKKEQFPTLRDALAGAARAPLRWARAGERTPPPTFWALRDVGFEVAPGEVVGIIGRNGAGKSTLLKILSRITEPTEGRIELYGRTSSLLEVGTGFHPELTGRENVYLNGAILGMKRAELARKFDEIVAFAEIEKFIDTPVKRYSSGMYVRLAFAVAAHLEPEILIVDEVLAVGDTQFQKKCIGKMGSVAKEGRTVLFVSHNLGAMRSLCGRALLLDGGTLQATGETEEVIHNYLAKLEDQLGYDLGQRVDRAGTGELKCVRVACLDSSKNEVPFLYPGRNCYLRLDFEAERTGLGNVKVAIGIDDSESHRITTLYSDFTGDSFEISGKKGSFVCAIPELNLRPDIYSISVLIGNEFQVFDVIVHAAKLEIQDANFFGTGRLPDKTQGPVLTRHSWSMTSDVTSNTA
ncbi:MAG TPA: ABC transporter ATP-binding protein [Pyrinomonadaceae bacterium]|jgi:lipopolysaccharide transport system ATP-binding protein|nr:ABC transporter ATP-binding protein [Pyrinomonadaceae bacterium]